MHHRGFTLIELMIVVSIIGILASIAIPAYQDYTIRAQVAESMTLTSELKISINDYYRSRGRFPAGNEAAGVPEPQQLIGNYITRVEVQGGALHVQFGNYVNSLVDGQTLSIRPLVVAGSPASPISWTCGHREAPAGMEAVGDNRTTIDAKYMPGMCR